MAINRPKPEEIVVELRQVEVLIGQGIPRIYAIRQISVTEQTYHHWKRSAVEWTQNNLRNLTDCKKRTSVCVVLQADPALLHKSVEGRSSPFPRRA